MNGMVFITLVELLRVVVLKALQTGASPHLWHYCLFSLIVGLYIKLLVATP